MDEADTQDGHPEREQPEWPERFPVLSPLVGVGVTLTATTVAAVEGDGIAATVFGALAGVLGAVAWRNSRISGQP